MIDQYHVMEVLNSTACIVCCALIGSKSNGNATELGRDS